MPPLPASSISSGGNRLHPPSWTWSCPQWPLSASPGSSVGRGGPAWVWLTAWNCTHGSQKRCRHYSYLKPNNVSLMTVPVKLSTEMSSFSWGQGTWSMNLVGAPGSLTGRLGNSDDQQVAGLEGRGSLCRGQLMGCPTRGCQRQSPPGPPVGMEGRGCGLLSSG